MLSSGWHEVESGWGFTGIYYIHDNGTVANGWTVINGKTYFFEFFVDFGMGLYGGHMYYGDSFRIEHELYLFDFDGVLITLVDGWNVLGVNRYYAKDGKLLGTLWVQDKGNRHYVNSLGRMARNGAYSTSDGGYYFDSNGVIKTGGWIHHQSESDREYDWWYYADADGKLASGWKKINNKWYYFYDTFEMNADEYFHVYEYDTEGNYTEYSVYYFDKTGAMVE